MMWLILLFVESSLSIKQQRVNIVNSSFQNLIHLYADCILENEDRTNRFNDVSCSTTGKRIYRNNYFHDYSGDFGGGAINIGGGENNVLEFLNNRFININAASGAAIYLKAKKVDIIGNTFSTIHSNAFAAIHCDNNPGTVEFSLIGNKFSSITSVKTGGALNIWINQLAFNSANNTFNTVSSNVNGGGINFDRASPIDATFRNDTFIKANSLLGGGLRFNPQSGSINMYDCNFEDCNGGSTGGGAIALEIQDGNAATYSVSLFGTHFKNTKASIGSIIRMSYKTNTINIIISKSDTRNTTIEDMSNPPLFYLAPAKLEISYTNIMRTNGDIFKNLDRQDTILTIDSCTLENCQDSESGLITQKWFEIHIENTIIDSCQRLFKLNGNNILKFSNTIFRNIPDRQCEHYFLILAGSAFNWSYINCIFDNSEYYMPIDSKFGYSSQYQMIYDNCSFYRMKNPQKVFIYSWGIFRNCVSYDCPMFKIMDSIRKLQIINCSGTNPSGPIVSMTCLNITKPEDFIIEDCSFKVASGNAMILTVGNLRNTTITNCKFEGESQDPSLVINGKVKLEGCTFGSRRKYKRAIKFDGGQLAFSLTSLNCIPISFNKTFEVSTANWRNIVDSDDIAINRWDTSNNLCYDDSLTKTETVQFSESIQFTNSIAYTNSKHFLASNDFSRSLAFMKTGNFQMTNEFSATNVFISTNDFSNSNNHKPSNDFSNSQLFKNTIMFPNTLNFIETNEFSKTTNFLITNDFSMSHDLSFSRIFYESMKFIETKVFSTTTDFSETVMFDRSSSFIKSNDFDMSTNFSASNPFKESNLFSESRLFSFSDCHRKTFGFSITSFYSFSDQFDGTFAFSASSMFKDSNDFSLSQDFYGSNSFNQSIEFIATKLFTQSREMSESVFHADTKYFSGSPRLTDFEDIQSSTRETLNEEDSSLINDKNAYDSSYISGIETSSNPQTMSAKPSLYQDTSGRESFNSLKDSNIDFLGLSSSEEKMNEQTSETSLKFEIESSNIEKQTDPFKSSEVDEIHRISILSAEESISSHQESSETQEKTIQHSSIIKTAKYSYTKNENDKESSNIQENEYLSSFNHVTITENDKSSPGKEDKVTYKSSEIFDKSHISSATSEHNSQDTLITKTEKIKPSQTYQESSINRNDFTSIIANDNNKESSEKQVDFSSIVHEISSHAQIKNSYDSSNIQIEQSVFHSKKESLTQNVPNMSSIDNEKMTSHSKITTFVILTSDIGVTEAIEGKDPKENKVGLIVGVVFAVIIIIIIVIVLIYFFVIRNVKRNQYSSSIGSFSENNETASSFQSTDPTIDNITFSDFPDNDIDNLSNISDDYTYEEMEIAVENHLFD